VAKLADAQDLGSCGETCAGSSPARRRLGVSLGPIFNTWDLRSGAGRMEPESSSSYRVVGETQYAIMTQPNLNPSYDYKGYLADII
jgi:hypothetical protein